MSSAPARKNALPLTLAVVAASMTLSVACAFVFDIMFGVFAALVVGPIAVALGVGAINAFAEWRRDR